MKIPYIYELTSFYKRRIRIPVDKQALVLDIGSGDKPHWRADVLLDEYVDEKYGVQRSGSKKVIITRPLVMANVEKMPFKNKSFDYIICSHLLEHVQNPDKAIKEILRVGKAGYIELPYEGSSRITDFPSHLWYCRKEGNTLIFTAKKTSIFNNEIEKLLSIPEINKAFRNIGKSNYDNFIVAFHWKNSFKYKVYGKANMAILKDAEKSIISHDTSNYKIRTFISMVFGYLYFYKKRREKVILTDILQCTSCGGSIKKIKSKFSCTSCKKTIKIIQK